MLEDHTNEQYFFDVATRAWLVDCLQPFDSICTLSTPTLGAALIDAGKTPVILDIDERFGHLPGFIKWDITGPAHMKQRFDLIICDPPFFNVSLRTLRSAIEILSHYDTTQKLAICYLTRRKTAVLKSFKKFGLCETGVRMVYKSVVPGAKNKIELLGNFHNGAVDRS